MRSLNTKRKAVIMNDIKTKNVKKLVALAMLAALSYAVMLVIKVPVMFLSYDAKDVVIALAGFIYGPLSAFIISAVVSLVEMVTVSDTGIIGCVMNILSTCSLVCTASFIYKRNKTITGAVMGLLSGVIFMTAIMLLWNYLITPLYMDQPREEVVKLLVPLFLPFNLIKGGINATATLLIYKPIVKALRRAKLIEPSEKASAGRKNNILGIMMAALFVLATCIVLMLVLKGII